MKTHLALSMEYYGILSRAMDLIITAYKKNTNDHTNKNINNSKINKQDANTVIATTEDDMTDLAEQTKQLNQQIMTLLQKYSSQ